MTKKIQLDNIDKANIIRCPCCEQSLEHNAQTLPLLYTPSLGDLRYPISNIVGISKILLDEDDGSLTGEQKQNLNIISYIGLDTFYDIMNMIDLIWLGKGNITLRLSTFNLTKIIDNVINRVQPFCQHKSIQINTELTDDLLNIEADELQVQNILHNLLLEAIKFTDKGSVTVRANQVDINQQQIMELIIIDPNNSKGMDRNKDIKLVLSRLLVELHGGFLWMEAADNIGVATHFTLPMRQ